MQRLSSHHGAPPTLHAHACTHTRAPFHSQTGGALPQPIELQLQISHLRNPLLHAHAAGGGFLSDLGRVAERAALSAVTVDTVPPLVVIQERPAALQTKDEV